MQIKVTAPMAKSRSVEGGEGSSGGCNYELRAEMILYQMRNEYGLLDLELYAVPLEEDDPEALL